MDIKKQWLRDIKRQGVGHYGLIDLGTGERTDVTVDRFGRVREATGEAEHPVLHPGWKRRYPSPAHTLGYAYAISDQLELLLIDVCGGPLHRWPEDWLSQVEGLRYPSPGDAFLAYEGYCAYYQALRRAVSQTRPQLLIAMRTFATRHGIDTLP